MSVPKLKDQDVRMLLCEDVRQDPNGKLTLAGFFPGTQIQVTAIGPGSAFQLALFFVIEAEVGEYKGQMVLRSPDKNELFKADVSATILPGTYGTYIVIKLMNFQALSEGTFEVLLELNGTMIKRNLSITRSASAV